MGEGVEQFFHGMSPSWVEECETIMSLSDETMASSSSDFRDDAVSSSSSSSSPPHSCSPDQDSTGPLFELSSLMAQLPIKRGLSKFFQGKSQSFKSLSSVRCIEDLAKKETRFKRKMKQCRSYRRGLDSDSSRGSYYVAMACKRIISKKASMGLCASMMSARKNSSSFVSSKHTPPLSKATFREEI